MVRRLGLRKNNHLTYASLALNPRYHVYLCFDMLGPISIHQGVSGLFKVDTGWRYVSNHHSFAVPTKSIFQKTCQFTVPIVNITFPILVSCKIIINILAININHSLDKFSRQQTDIFPYFPQKIGFDISCKLSPTICMKCQSLFLLFFYYYFFFQKIGFDISCKLSPKETICKKCQSLFSGKK